MSDAGLAEQGFAPQPKPRGLTVATRLRTVRV
jgi:hypothetical protein